MSNDLISRKEAVESVKRIIQAGLPEESIYAEMEEISTAYDVDAVCKELEKCMEASKEAWNAIDSEQDFGEMMAYQNALRIVKNGGKK